MRKVGVTPCVAGGTQFGSVIKLALKELRALAAEVVGWQAKARAMGLFANDRELLECPGCGLQEDVTFSGHLITSPRVAVGRDTGLRFEELPRGGFRCPACGATVREPVSDVPGLKKPKGRKRPCRARRGRS